MRPAHLNVLQRRAPISLGDPTDDDPTDPTDANSDGGAAGQTTSARTSAGTTSAKQQTTDDPDNDTTSTSQSQNSRPTDRQTSQSAPNTSSSTSSSSSSTSTSSSSTSSRTSLSTSAVVHGGSTSFVTNIVTVGQTSSSASSAASGGGGSSGPGAGTVVGVVAGSLVGIVVIAGLIGYFFKTKFGKDKDDDIDDAVFNKNDFRHESILLQDDDMDRVSMRSGSAAGSLNAAGLGGMHRMNSGLARHNTSATSPFDNRHAYNASPVQGHYAAPPMPSFQPGQIVNANWYNGPAAQPGHTASEGGWGVAASYAGNNNGSLQPGNQGAGAHLDRQASVASHYGDVDGRGGYEPASYSSPNLTSSFRTANEHDYPPHGGRAGSPVDQQQFYEALAGTHEGGKQTRQLSVRNRDRDSDAYEGMGF